MDIKKLKNIKITYLVIALAAGIALVALSDGLPKSDPGQTAETQTQKPPDNSSVEKRLEKIIESIDGVSEADVFVTYENSGVKTIATVSDESTSTDEGKRSFTGKSQAVTVRDGSSEEPFVEEEKLPEVRGVIISAKGVGDASLNALITDAVASAMGVPVHRVKILSKD